MAKLHATRTLQAFVRPTMAVLLVAGTALPQGRTTPSPRSRSDSVSVVVVYSDAYNSGIQVRDPLAVLVSNRASFAALWRRLGVIQPLPNVDFRRGSVVVVGSGSEPTEDYDLVIRSVEARPNEIAVHADLKTPGFSCLTPQAVSHPLVVAQLIGRRVTVAHPPVRLYLTKVRKPRCPP